MHKALWLWLWLWLWQKNKIQIQSLSLEFMEFSLRILLNPVPTRLYHVIYCCWFSIIWKNVTKTEGHEMMRSNFHDRFTIIPHMNYGVYPKFQFLLNSTLKKCQTQSLVWWWLDQKGANSPNILHSHLYWHPTIHSCLAKISWSGFEHGSNADDNHCTAHCWFFFQSQKGTNRQEIRLLKFLKKSRS